MKDYDFTVSVHLRKNESHDNYLKALEQHTDALVGIGNPDMLGLAFTKTAESKMDALKEAVQEIKQAIPDPDIWTIQFED